MLEKAAAAAARLTAGAYLLSWAMSMNTLGLYTTVKSLLS